MDLALVILEESLCKCNEVKYLEMRSSWIILMGLKSNEKSP